MRTLVTRILSTALALGAVTAMPLLRASEWGNDPHSKTYMGVHIDSISPDQVSALKLKDTDGVLVTGLDQDGPACKAGLLENDVIVSFNGTKVNSPEELGKAIWSLSPGKAVPVVVIRDGTRKDMSVTLGRRDQMAVLPVAPLPPSATHSPVHPMPPVAAMTFMPDVEVPTFAHLSARNGIVVEALCPQMSDFFGVPANRGVLVRTVEKGSPAAAAGLKAGDVIVKVNSDLIHDVAEWRRSMPRKGGKVTLGIVRDKREQTIEMALPTLPDNSGLQPWVWDESDSLAFQKEMEGLGEQMRQLGPEIERQSKEMATLNLNDKELAKMSKEIEKAMKHKQKDLEKLSRDAQKHAPSQKDMELLQKQIQASLPDRKQFEEMTRNIQRGLPSQADMQQMQREIEQSMKDWAPKLQQQMEQLQKEMEHWKLNQEQPEPEYEF